MTDVVRTIDSTAAPERVWEELSDYGGIAAWAPNVDHSTLLSGRSEGVGAVRRIQSGRTTLIETVTEWNEPTVLTYDIAGLPAVVKHVTSTWRVERAGTGSRISLTNTVDTGSRPPQKLVARLVARRLAQASEKMLAALALRCADDRPDPEDPAP